MDKSSCCCKNKDGDCVTGEVLCDYCEEHSQKGSANLNSNHHKLPFTSPDLIETTDKKRPDETWDKLISAKHVAHDIKKSIDITH
uniref:Zn(2)-C6 fungal-type domain-containing protein n=1 Tax=Rhabditophanes sp. KR3021 TaxID=114890 RepID=A0AC35TFY4_9BILA